MMYYNDPIESRVFIVGIDGTYQEIIDKISKLYNESPDNKFVIYYNNDEV